MKKREKVILELSEKTIKICRAGSSNKRTLINSLESRGISFGSVQKDIEEVLSGLPGKKSYNLTVSLDRSLFLIRFLKLPSQDIIQIRDMLPFQLVKVVPFALEEIIYDFSIVEQEAGFSKVIVFIIPSEKIDRLRGFLMARQIEPEVTITSWGLSSWLNLQRKSLKEQSGGSLILIDIDGFQADFLIFDKARLIFSHDFSYSSDGDLLRQINDSLAFFKKEFGQRNFSRVIFTGLRKETIFKNMNVAEKLFINYWENFNLSEDEQSKFPNGRSFASVLGLVENGNLGQFDFSPKALKERKQKIKLIKKYLDIFSLGLGIVLILSLFLFKHVYGKYSYLKFLESKLVQTKIQATYLNKLSKRLKIIDRDFLMRPSFSEALRALIISLPPGVTLSFLSFQEDGDFSLKGQAPDLSAILQIVKSLNSSEFFKEVKLEHASKSEEKAKKEVNFCIRGRRWL
ncbi:MAG: PilN domain-containing protein [Candidatus Omnitrophica bacterium]|nr:PilN domain-containing protein [Candidatus Omnitrophota bacterium]